jgi:hypothetical protein
MRSKSRSTLCDVNARDPRQSALAHAFYPQTAGLKLVTRPHGDSRHRHVCTVRPGKLRDGRAKSIVPSSSGATLADEIVMSEENDSVLGNLPRSRPGVRSEKRESSKRADGAGAAAGSPPAQAATPSTKPRTKAAARPKAAPPRATRARKPAAERPPQPPPSRPSDTPTDPIGMALKAGETVAVTGLKVAGRMAGEVWRRLPRP